MSPYHKATDAKTMLGVWRFWPQGKGGGLGGKNWTYFLRWRRRPFERQHLIFLTPTLIYHQLSGQTETHASLFCVRERERETEREPERAQLIIQVSNTGVGISEIKSYLHCWVVLSPDEKLEKSLSSKRSDPSSICKVPPLFTASLRIGDSCIRLKEIILFWSAGTDLVSRWSGPQLMAFWLQLDKNQSRVGTPALGTQRCRCISRKMFKI